MLPAWNGCFFRALRSLGLMLAIVAGACPAAQGQSLTGWTPYQAYMPRCGHTIVEFNGRLLALGGNMTNYDNTTWAVGCSNEVWSSADGKGWNFITSAPFFPRYQHTALIYQNRIWVLGGKSIFPLGDTVWSSPDGTTWTQANGGPRTLPRQIGHSSAVFNDRMWVIGGSLGFEDASSPVYWSADGAAWTTATKAAAFSLRLGHGSVVFGGKMWVIGGQSGGVVMNNVLNSADGATWTTVTAHAEFPPRYFHNSMVYNNKIWVIGGFDGQDKGLGDVWSSSDGLYWERAAAAAGFAPRGQHAGIVYQGKMWIFGGTTGRTWPEYWYPSMGEGPKPEDPDYLNDAYSSADGTTWQAEARPFGVRTNHLSLVHNGKIWVLGGYRPLHPQYFDDFSAYSEIVYYNYASDVWSSGDGFRWTQATADAGFILAGQAAAAASFNGKMWVIGGLPNHDAWQSADGAVWTPAAVPADLTQRNSHKCLVLNGKLWLIGGFQTIGSTSVARNDVWCSNDGTSWSQALAAAPFTPRGKFGATNFAGRMWVAGGTTSQGQYLYDLWSSPDGVQWSSAANRLPLADYESINNLVALGGALWLSSSKNLWCSRDGDWWIKANPENRLYASYPSSLLVFQNKLWLTGGTSKFLSQFPLRGYPSDINPYFHILNQVWSAVPRPISAARDWTSYEP